VVLVEARGDSGALVVDLLALVEQLDGILKVPASAVATYKA
jgi:hypothetical protein